MKKFLMPLILGLSACTSEHIGIQKNDEDAKIVKVSAAEMNIDEPKSRWIYDENNKFGWKSNDVLGIFPVGKGSQLEFPVDLKDGETAETVMFDGGGWGFKSGYNYSAYSPYNLLSNRGNQIKFSYANQCRKMDGNNFDLRENMFRVTPPTSVTDGTIFFLFYNAEAFLRIELYDLSADKTYKSLTLYAEDEVIPLEKEYDIFTVQINESKNVTIENKVLSVSNHLKMDLMDARPIDDMLLVWMAFPVVGNSYGSLKAVVEDSDGNLYIGDVKAKDSSDFNKELKTNSRTTVRVNKFTPVNGVSGGIEDWEMGEEILGSAN